MNDEVTDLRKDDRYLVVELVEGAFNGVPVALLNMGLGGAQLLHAQPIRIGTHATLTFTRAGVGASLVVSVVWSHLSQTNDGLRYRSGVKLLEPDVRYATALNAYIRTGVVDLDRDSLERKRQRQLERELRRQSSPKMSSLPPST